MKRKYSARSTILEPDAAVKRQRIQLPSESIGHRQHAPSTTFPKTSLEAWLKPCKSSPLFSSSPKLDVDTPPSSPPSSAPRSEPNSPQRLHYRKPTFSFLRRPRSAPLPLSESKSSGNAKPGIRNAKATQLTIDLGAATTITCSECAMSYTPSQADDAALHAKHHAAHLSRLNISLELWRSIQDDKACWKSSASRECILQVTHDDRATFKNLAERILEIASQDLGAVDISRSQLWSKSVTKEHKYIVFLYLKNRKCTGLLLAERIDTAYRVLASKSIPGRQESEPLNVSETPLLAKIGVSRIWTRATERNTGVATRLLETLRTTRVFGYGLTTDKALIAFSQPTELGAALARKWFGKQYDWLVYRD